MKPRVINMNEGNKIDYEIFGNKIILRMNSC